MRVEKLNDPFPHAVLTDVIPENVYGRLAFPALQKRNNTRAGWDLFKGEKKYDEFFSADENWGAVRKLLDSQEFILSLCNIFKEELKQKGIDTAKLKLIEYTETPAQMQMGQIAFGKFDNRIFSRFDLQASDGTTLRSPHVDHARRLIGGVIFFCDPKEEGIVGGDFGIWRDRQYRGDRKPHDCEMVKTYPIQHNTMYIFLNRNDAFHAPKPVIATAGLRKWAYFSVSARQNLWKVDPGATTLLTEARVMAGAVKGYVNYHASNWRAGSNQPNQT